MNNNDYLLVCIFGAAVGALSGWYVTKRVYERILESEIASVKEVYNRNKKTADSEAVEKDDFTPEEKKEYGHVVAALYAAENRNKKEKAYWDTRSDYSADKGDRKEKAYVITPDEFGEMEGYERITLTYYSDNILADDNDTIIENLDDIISESALEQFGEYEDDSVFVRNDRLKTDYEILMDYRTYEEVVKSKPYTEET